MLKDLELLSWADMSALDVSIYRRLCPCATGVLVPKIGVLVLLVAIRIHPPLMWFAGNHVMLHLHVA